MSNKKTLITEAIKALGYNSRQVSVKDNGGSSNWSFDVTIRDASVNYEKLSKAVNRFEKIDRCEASYEILSGGNTYVTVRLSDEVQAKWSEPYVEKVQKAISGLKDDRYGEQIDDRFDIFMTGAGGRIYKVWDNNYKQEGRGMWLHMDYCNPQQIALDIAIIYQNSNLEPVNQ
jgi:hypothetical protein